jgi:hypothetical protein
MTSVSPPSSLPSASASAPVLRSVASESAPALHSVASSSSSCGEWVAGEKKVNLLLEQINHQTGGRVFLGDVMIPRSINDHFVVVQQNVEGDHSTDSKRARVFVFVRKTPLRTAEGKMVWANTAEENYGQGPFPRWTSLAAARVQLCGSPAIKLLLMCLPEGLTKEVIIVFDDLTWRIQHVTIVVQEAMQKVRIAEAKRAHGV